MKHTIIYLSILASSYLFYACNSESAETTTSEVAPSMGQPTAIVEVEQQPNFDQSQLTPALLGLCVQFKNRQGQDRKALFEKLEPILPKCPIVIGEDNSSDFDFSDAKQRMGPNDLTEILGAPDEVLQEGALVYHLTPDKSYRALFFMDERGIVACSATEADS